MWRVLDFAAAMGVAVSAYAANEHSEPPNAAVDGDSTFIGTKEEHPIAAQGPGLIAAPIERPQVGTKRPGFDRRIAARNR
jgi:hypothetical protein